MQKKILIKAYTRSHVIEIENYSQKTKFRLTVTAWWDYDLPLVSINIFSFELDECTYNQLLYFPSFSEMWQLQDKASEVFNQEFNKLNTPTKLNKSA